MSIRAEDQLAKLGRYEALFELTGKINASVAIEDASAILAGRLKYVADVFAWRYLSVEGRGAPGRTDPTVILIDGFRGRAEVHETGLETLSVLETKLWDEPRAKVLCEGADAPEFEHLPDSFRRPDVAQVVAHPVVESGERRALFLCCKRREAFNELDLKFIGLVCGFFHRRVQMLWEQRKLRELETAYLQQEITLRQSEKLATLGRLSAGMAHELNNPSSAALRAAQQLWAEVAQLQRSRDALAAFALTPEQTTALAELEERARERAAEPSELDPLDRSDLEDRLEDWLDERGIDDAGGLAPALAAVAETPESLADLVSRFEEASLGAVLPTLAAHYNVYRLLEEMGQGVTRIADIVRALKSYSYMDQAPIQQVDVRKGLDNTLVMLRSKLKEGVRIVREYAEELPRVEASGGELNQVWTNIVDNAVAAMSGAGELRLKAYPEGSRVVVEITDSGPGIPEEIRHKVFDPFFTTKAPGDGTGLGLNISHNIVVNRHGGEITVDSRPGRTTFAVKLPFALEPARDGVESAENGPPRETPGRAE